MNIRLAQSGDKERVLEMAQNFYSVSGYEEHIPFDRETCADLFDTSMSMGLCSVAEDHEIVGFVLGIAAPALMNKNYLMGCELAWWVEPAYRGHVGIDLLKQIEDSARKLGLRMWSMVALETQNPEMVEKIYLDSGYTKTERTYTMRLH